MKIPPAGPPPQRSADSDETSPHAPRPDGASASPVDRRPEDDSFIVSPRQPGIRQAVLESLRKVLGTPFPLTSDAHRERERAIQDELMVLQPLSPHQKLVLRDIRTLGVDDVHLWHGSHVVVRDDGQLYRDWKGLSNCAVRASSHYRDHPAQQYEVPFQPLGALLFGRTEEENTWFQMENSASAETITHALDYLKHKLSGNWNVGPLGLSPHSEKRSTEVVLPYRQ